MIPFTAIRNLLYLKHGRNVLEVDELKREMRLQKIRNLNFEDLDKKDVVEKLIQIIVRR
jgi:hypothetical protein